MTIPSLQPTGPVRTYKVAELDEIPDGGSKLVSIAGRTVAVFRVKDEYFAMANNCLHRGGPLGEGEVSNYEVTCPWHGWKYSITSGAFSLIPTLKVKTFPVKATPEGVFVEA